MMDVGHGITGFGRRLVEEVANAPRNLNDRVESLYQGADFEVEDTARNQSSTISNQDLPNDFDRSKYSGDMEPILARKRSSTISKQEMPTDFDGSKDPARNKRMPSYTVEPPTPTTTHEGRPSTSSSRKKNWPYRLDFRLLRACS